MSACRRITHERHPRWGHGEKHYCGGCLLDECARLREALERFAKRSSWAVCLSRDHYAWRGGRQPWQYAQEALGLEVGAATPDATLGSAPEDLALNPPPKK